MWVGNLRWIIQRKSSFEICFCGYVKPGDRDEFSVPFSAACVLP
jgi:hypothetical protein